MIDAKLVVYISIAVITIVGSIVTFFVMQKEQNMKIKALETALEKLEKKQSKSTEHQIETEKLVVEINTKLDHITKAIDKLTEARGLE